MPMKSEVSILYINAYFQLHFGQNGLEIVLQPVGDLWASF